MTRETRLRMLIVDDNETFLAGLTRWVADDPAIELVGVARSGPEALDAAERLRPDLVILEAVLPGMDGFRVAGALKALPRPPLVVIATFLASETARGEALAAGADGFLPKDEFAEGLGLVLDAIVSGRSAPSPVSARERPTRLGSRTVPDP